MAGPNPGKSSPHLVKPNATQTSAIPADHSLIFDTVHGSLVLDSKYILRLHSSFSHAQIQYIDDEYTKNLFLEVTQHDAEMFKLFKGLDHIKFTRLFAEAARAKELTLTQRRLAVYEELVHRFHITFGPKPLLPIFGCLFVHHPVFDTMPVIPSIKTLQRKDRKKIAGYKVMQICPPIVPLELTEVWETVEEFAEEVPLQVTSWEVAPELEIEEQIPSVKIIPRFTTGWHTYKCRVKSSDERLEGVYVTADAPRQTVSDLSFRPPGYTSVDDQVSENDDTICLMLSAQQDEPRVRFFRIVQRWSEKLAMWVVDLLMKRHLRYKKVRNK